jgi:hypothetical protein
MNASEAMSQPRRALDGFDVDAVGDDEYGAGGGVPYADAVDGNGAPADRTVGSFSSPTGGPDRSTVSVGSVCAVRSASSGRGPAIEPAISVPQFTQNRLN